MMGKPVPLGMTRKKRLKGTPINRGSLPLGELKYECEENYYNSFGYVSDNFYCASLC
jgi:hypothetical protein